MCQIGNLMILLAIDAVALGFTKFIGYARDFRSRFYGAVISMAQIAAGLIYMEAR